MDYTDYLKCRILQHVLAKLDARKSDDSNRGDSISTRNLKSKGGGRRQPPPPMMFEEELIQIGVQLLCKQSKQ